MKQRLVRTVVACTLSFAVPLCALGETLTRTSAFVYDDTSGLLVREIIEPDSSALCLVTDYAYDSYGNRTTATKRNCNGTSPEATAPSGDPVFSARTNTNSYAAGSTVVGGTTYNWPAGLFAASTTNALGQAETREFDPRFGVITKLTGPNGLVTTRAYDGFGRKTSETRADATTTTWAFALCTACLANGAYSIIETTTGAPVKSKVFDNLNRVIVDKINTGFSGAVVRIDIRYDTLGRVSQVSKPRTVPDATYWTNYQYDILGRVTQVDEPATASGTQRTATAYSGLTTTATVSNAGSAPQARTTAKNSQGQVTTVTDTQSNTVTYTYDPFANLKTTNAGGVITSLTYDLRGRKTQMVDKDMGSWAYAYNALGELIRQTDAKSQVASMQYDLLGRMTQRTEADLTSNWYYDAYQGGGTCTKGTGKLCQVTASNGYNRTLTYDSSYGRLSSISTTIDTTYSVSFTYDSASRLDTTTYPATGLGTPLKVQNVYNSYGYLSQVRDYNTPSTVYWQANSQNATGQVTSELLGNGLTTTRTYDEIFRMTGTQSSNGGGTVHNLSYTYDVFNNVLQRVDAVQAISENFQYDTLKRLTQVTGLTTRSFSYAAIGNLTYKSDVGTYTYPSVTSTSPHAVSSVTNGATANSLTATYGYDLNGSLTSASGTIYPASGSMAFSRTLAYTSYNMPNVINETRGSNSYSYTYTYNADHVRVRLVTVRPTDTLTSVYLHPGGSGALLYEKETRASDGRIEHKHYVNGGAGLVGVFVTKSSYDSGQGPEMRYYHRDNLGSIAAITNPSGAVLERLSYEAFGERRNPSGAAQDRTSPLVGITTDRGFTAHEHLDELNLIHMNGRIFDPALSRFMTADPFFQSASNLQSYNRYSYGLNNPLSGIDPSGYSWVSDLKDQVVNGVKDFFNSVGEVPYVGGLAQVGLLTCPYGQVYGLSTGEWQSVARAYAISAVLAAGVYAGGVAASAYSQPILLGAASSGVSLSAAQYVGANAIIAFNTSFAVAKINGASTQDALRGSVRGAAMSVPFTLVDIAAVNMRADQIADSQKFVMYDDPLDARDAIAPNASKDSMGYRGDGFGLGGCRYPCTDVPLGSAQGGPGRFFNWQYSKGDFLDWLVEANAGPHDYLSKWQYNSLGNMKPFYLSGIGDTLGMVGSATVLAVSVPISFGSVLAPYSGVLYSNRYLNQ